MTHKLGVSGSTIYSNPDLFLDLFWEGIDHIEIGEFPDEKALNYFLNINKERHIPFGIHSPLLCSGSKYDLIEKVQHDTKFAWKQLELEAEKMSSLGSDYLLVHFPYFKTKVNYDTNIVIEDGLKKLNYIQNKYSIQLVCEPKLGINRSPAGINYLHNFPIETWKKYNVKLCVDIGDYLVATDKQILNYLSKWKDFIKVVHLHNIEYKDNKYYWIPVHPSLEHNNINYKLEEIIKFLAECKDVTFIFEHTPECNPSKDFVSEGFKWVKSLIS